jgi:hypothetical protein
MYERMRIIALLWSSRLHFVRENNELEKKTAFTVAGQ